MSDFQVMSRTDIVPGSQELVSEPGSPLTSETCSGSISRFRRHGLGFRVISTLLIRLGFFA